MKTSRPVATRSTAAAAPAETPTVGVATAQAPALFRRFPELAASIPWLPLGDYPTPVHPLGLDGFPADDVWVKRDDLGGGRYGGNKVRKLEFLLADAQSRGVRRLITIGAAGSHHALATTVYARALGIDVTLLLFPQPLTDHVRRNLHLDHALGAEIRFVSRTAALPLALLAARRAHRGERLHVVAPGGSDLIGTLGYVNGALELADQVQRCELPVPRVIHVAGGTLGTAAGLAVGCELAGLPTRIVATRVVSRAVTNRLRLRRLVRGVLRRLGRAGIEPPSGVEVLKRVVLSGAQLGRGYGYPTEACQQAAARFAAAGIHVEPTYTAKAAAELIDCCGTEVGPILFWHTFSSVQPLATPEPGLPPLPPRVAAWLAAAETA